MKCYLTHVLEMKIRNGYIALQTGVVVIKQRYVIMDHPYGNKTINSTNWQNFRLFQITDD